MIITFDYSFDLGDFELCDGLVDISVQVYRGETHLILERAVLTFEGNEIDVTKRVLTRSGCASIVYEHIMKTAIDHVPEEYKENTIKI